MAAFYPAHPQLASRGCARHDADLRGFAMRVVYANRSRLPVAVEARHGVAPAALPRLLGDPTSSRCTPPENGGLMGAA
jgi:hypothetical protein